MHELTDSDLLKKDESKVPELETLSIYFIRIKDSS